jgi:hypothetical protein
MTIECHDIKCKHHEANSKEYKNKLYGPYCYTFLGYDPLEEPECCYKDEIVGIYNGQEDSGE